MANATEADPNTQMRSLFSSVDLSRCSTHIFPRCGFILNADVGSGILFNNFVIVYRLYIKVADFCPSLWNGTINRKSTVQHVRTTNRYSKI